MGNNETDGTCVWFNGAKVAEKTCEEEARLTLAGNARSKAILNAICDQTGNGRPYSWKKGQPFFDLTPITEDQWTYISI